MRAVRFVRCAALVLAVAAIACKKRRSVASQRPSSSVEPTVTVRTNATVAAWMSTRNGEFADAIGVSYAQGELAGSTLLRAPPRSFVADPTVAIRADGSIAVTWLAFRAVRGADVPTHLRVMGAELDDHLVAHATYAWSGEVDPATTLDHPSMAVDARDEAYVAWRFSAPGHAGVAIATRSGKYGPIRRSIIVDRSDFVGVLPVVCTASSRAYVTWIDPLAGVAVRAVEGARVSDLSAVASSADAPSTVAIEQAACAANDDALYVVYGLATRPFDSSRSAEISRVIVVRSRDGGATFDARWEISEHAAAIMHPGIALGGDGVDVVYYAGKNDGDPEGSLRRVHVSDAGASSSEVLRAHVPFVERRDARGWPGDYLGVARAADGELVVASIDHGRVVIDRR